MINEIDGLKNRTRLCIIEISNLKAERLENERMAKNTNSKAGLNTNQINYKIFVIKNESDFLKKELESK